MRIKKGFILREIAGNHVVVPVGKATVNFNGIINLNKTGAFLWKQMAEDRTMEELVKAILDNYNITEEVAKADVFDFIETLKEAKLLEE